jgi:dCMP deaminase
VIVDREHTVLTMGYNSPPRGSRDAEVPLSRPAKYLYFAHAEEAAIANAARNGVSLLGAVAYVTGHPCATCTRLLINAGVREVVMGAVGSHCVSGEVREAVTRLVAGREDFVLREYRPDVVGMLGWTADYYALKSAA